MTWDGAFQFVTQYLLPFMGLPLIGVVVGAWLTNSFFPFRLKRREWRWEKEVWAKELFFESVSRVNFIAEHYLKSEYEEKFSMSGLALHEADDEIVRLVKELHSVGHKLKLYLNKSDAKLFEQYLYDSQREYDAAKESWGQWDEDDDLAVTQHTENTIARQGHVAANTIEKFKLSEGLMKSFLTNNKIYFETIATLTLTVMALVVSMKANSIAEYSAMLSKIDHLPRVSAEFKLEENKNGAKSEYLVIQNSGEVMYQFKAYSFAFLDLRELKLMVPGEADRPSALKKALIPLGNVFSNISYTSDENKGLISRRPIRDGNNLDEVISKFSSEQSSDNRSFDGTVERYLVVSYVDKFGDPHNQFFKFSPFGTSIPMTDRLGEQLLSRHNQFSEKDQLLDYVSGTKSDLLEYWKRLSKERIVLN